MPCELCLQQTTDRPYRLAGLDACEVCFSGALGDAWAAWGLKAETRHWTEWERNGDNRVLVQHSHVHITHPTTSTARAKFTRQHNMPAVLRWIGLGRPVDPEVGDPLFDDFVQIDGDADLVLPLLADEGLQTAIMSVVAAERTGSCELTGNAIDVRMRNDDNGSVNQGEIDALVTAIAVQVERFARGMT